MTEHAAATERAAAGEPVTDGGAVRFRPTVHVYVLAALFAVAAGLYITYSMVLFGTFRSSTYDLVIFDQGIRSYSRFHAPIAVVKGVHNGFGPNFSILGDHFSPILVVLAPLYWIHDSPVNLLVAQAVLLAAAISPLWVYVRRVLGTWSAYAMTVVYAVSWPVAGTVAFDFHETAFVPVLSAVLLERHQAGRRRWHVIAAAAALLLVKEDMGLLVAGFGLYLLTRRGERRLGAGFVVCGLIWTVVATRVLIPALGGSATYYWAYGALGQDLPHAALHVLTHPWDAARLLGTPNVKLWTMWWLIAPLLLLPLFSPITLAALPLLASRMMSSSFPNWWDQRYHYNVALVIILIAAGVDGAHRLHRLRWLWWARFWPIATLAVSVATIQNFAFGEFFHSDFYRQTGKSRAAAAASQMVPSGVYVETANVVGPHLTARDKVLLWDNTPRWAPWVVADVNRQTFPFPSREAQRARVALLLANGYHVVWQRNGYLVLNRPGSVPDLRATR